MKLSLEHRRAVAWVVSCYGLPGHRATEDNLDDYERRFVIACLRDAIQCAKQSRSFFGEGLLEEALEHYEQPSHGSSGAGEVRRLPSPRASHGR